MPAPGCYDLTGDEARRGGEWLTGIARMMQARFSETTLPLVKPYLDIVRAFNPPRELEAYPGSPLIARALLRPQDRLTACEVEPKARKHLIDALRRDTQARVVDLDGWTGAAGLRAAERAARPGADRSVVRAEGRVRTAGRRIRRGLREMADRQLSDLVSGEEPARHRHPRAPGRRARSAPSKPAGKVPAARIQRRAAGRGRPPSPPPGLLIVNPPWTLAGELKTILPELEKPLGQGGAGRFRLETPKP